ncbi:hypothetical protein IE077_002537, partial [Cardiosporidium cionae]
DKSTLLLESYEAFLKEFPLLYGYWKRLASLTLEVKGWEAAYEVYMHALTYLKHNPEMWFCFLAFILTSSPLTIEKKRSIIDKALEASGKHWLSWKLWKLAIEYEEELLRKPPHNDVTSTDYLAHISDATLRLRSLYCQCLSSPLKESSDCWKKFEGLVGQGDEEKSPLPITVLEMLNEDELLALDMKIQNSIQKSENTNFNVEAFQNRIKTLKAIEMKNFEVEKM